jgi:hypothetical protein
MYHNDQRPSDRNGVSLKPLDLVVVASIPEHFWADPEFRQLKEYAGSYGLVTYYDAGTGPSCSPWHFDRKGHPGWVMADNSAVNVLCRRVAGDVITSYDFWIPPATLTKIPYNVLVMTIFADYPWQMNEDEGPSAYPFIRGGMPEFDHIRRIIETPYAKLVEAHDAAMAVLPAPPS